MTTVPDDDLAKVVKKIVASFDDFERPLLPAVRAAFNLSVPDAVAVIRAAHIVRERHARLPPIEKEED